MHAEEKEKKEKNIDKREPQHKKNNLEISSLQGETLWCLYPLLI